ncbi:MAG: hypothetical protein QOE70_4616 [Chthoniobacter sp.]|jgi:hypothetical protein|nr:hypothetical protein [Chthoniobacter sp.]
MSVIDRSRILATSARRSLAQLVDDSGGNSLGTEGRYWHKGRGMSSPKIFISYRRDDTRWAAGLIYRSLIGEFGEDSVFYDRRSIDLGSVWPERLRQSVQECRVLIAVIGKAWLGGVDDESQSRLEQENDWVRRELRTVLQREDQPLVIPLFIDGARAPDRLPEDLKKLARCQGRPVRDDPDFDNDFEPVIKQIAALLGPDSKPLTVAERERKLAEFNATPAGMNRQRMIAKVRDAWIRGVLDRSLSGIDSFALGLDFAPTAVVEPRGLPAAQLLGSRNIAEVFEEFDRRLLILGSPGGGKTILLLQLARRLLNNAESEIDAPIPVILNLSSWAARRLPLHRWLVQDLAAAYQVPAKVARDWIERKQLLLLLDGLDEVAAEHRAACVERINAHLDTWPTLAIAVCSRLRDYEEIGARLKLRAAVRLEALDPARAQELIAGQEYEGVRAVAEEEPALHDMLTVPFLLSLIRVAYRGRTREYLALSLTDEPIKARREDLFQAYLEARMDEADANTARGKLPFYRRQVLNWLSWLAANMQQRAESILYIENLQSSWLRTPFQRMAFAIISSAAFGAMIGGIGGCELAAAWALEDAVIVSSIIFGVIGALVFVHGALGRMTVRPLLADWRPDAKSVLRPLFACSVIAFGTVFALGMPLRPLLTRIVPGGRPPLHPAALWLMPAATAALYFPLLMLAFRGLHRLLGRFRWWQPWMSAPTLAMILIGAWLAWSSEDFMVIHLAGFMALTLVVQGLLALGGTINEQIYMVEQLSWRWSWRGSALGAAVGLGISGSVVVAVALFLSELLRKIASDRGISWMDLRGDAVSIVGIALMGSVLGGMWGGLRKSERLTERHHPGAGLSQTLKHTGIVSAGFTLTGMFVCALGFPITDWISSTTGRSSIVSGDAAYGALTGAGFGLIIGLFLGGSDALVKHWLLRLQLRATGCLPLRVGRLLSHASDCLLLRRVGAGYIFLHRYLLEYFATLCPADLVRRGAPAGESADQSAS